MKLRKKRIIAASLIAVLSLSMGFSAVAAPASKGSAAASSKTKEKSEDDNLTEAEKQAKAELEKAYKIPTESNKWEGWKKGPGTYGEAAIVMEASTGAILYAKNIDSKQYPASITKVLTALVALENGDMADKVTFSRDCVSFMQPGDSSVGLKEGNVITLEQALYAMLLASANESAYAVGENVGKNAGYDYNWFIEQMNTRVQELGGVNSNFVNTNGLHDPNHYTCARDMALIGCELFKHHPEFFEIVQTLQYKIPKTKKVEEHVFQQKHKMLQPRNENYYKYAVGGKTGFTSDAKSTLITMAEKDGVDLVCVVLRTYGRNVYPDTTKLFKYGFKNFKKVDVETEESSEDFARILTDSDESHSVMLPKGVTFADLDREIIPDAEDSTQVTVSYSYKGTYVGKARAELSEEYIRAHNMTKEDDSGKEKVSEKKTDDSEKGKVGKLKSLLIKSAKKVYQKLHLNEKSKQDQIILLAAFVVWVVLVMALIVVLICRRIKYRKHRKNRSGRK